MAYEIIYVCKSINNRNIRRGELKILNKYENKLYFEFGENPKNIKKRYYRDLKTLNEDYENVLKLKHQEEEEKQEIQQQEIKEEEKPLKVEEKIIEKIEEDNTQNDLHKKAKEKGHQGRGFKKRYSTKNSELF